MATITPYLLYADVDAALAWLHDAFGFEEVLRYDDGGTVTHAEARLDGAVVYLGHPGPDYRGPGAGAGVTVMLHVEVDDVAAHHARASAASSAVGDLEDTPYGERRYRAVDLEGHEWFFASRVREVAPEDWGAVSSS